MKVTLADGTAIEYQDAGRGPPIVLLHAFPLAHAMWRPQIEVLGRSHRVIAPDQRGFGGSGGFRDAPSMNRMADDVADLLDALLVAEPVVLGGLSMGGYVALAFARRHPERLRALILADTRAEADTDEAKANRERLIALAERHGAAGVIEQMMPKMVGDETRSQRPEVIEEIRKMATAQTTEGVCNALRAMRDRPDSTPFLGAVKVPTLVLVGTEDTLTPPANAEAIGRGIAGARLAMVPGAGHISNLEKPADFSRAVDEFLRSLA